MTRPRRLANRAVGAMEDTLACAAKVERLLQPIIEGEPMTHTEIALRCARARSEAQQIIIAWKTFLQETESQP